MNKEKLKILLLQIRQDEAVRKEEHESFAKYSGLKIDQIDILNVFDTPNFDFKQADAYDAVFVGGASEASVLEPEIYSFVPHSIDFLNYLIDKKKPVFASCFGFQLAVLALGGEIIHDSQNYEMGTYQITLTEAARTDSLTCDTPDGFWAISVHKEKALVIPESCELLGYTQDSVHLFKVKNAPFWAFQFHPEVDKPSLILRLKAYQEKYTDGDDHLNQVIESVVDTPVSNRLPFEFVSKILLKS